MWYEKKKFWVSLYTCFILPIKYQRYAVVPLSQTAST